MTVLISKKGFVFCTLLLCLVINLQAQKKDIPADLYNSSSIPDSLRKDANSVVRYSELQIEVKAPSKAIIRHHSIQTILDEKAASEALMVIGYDKKFSSVGHAELNAYDAAGKLIKRYKKSDMYDRSAIEESSIITDGRILAVGHTIVTYPVTIEKIYEKEVSSFLDLGDWVIQDQEESVQNAVCKITVNPTTGFRYKTKNIKLEPRKSTSDGMDVYQWEVKNLKAAKKEEDSKPWKVIPRILFATNNIDFDGVAGDMSTWKGFGIWQQTLNKDLSTFSPQREEEIRHMVSGLATEKEKTKFLYEYMQKNMRYVSIQLGIGGLKPFPASFVDEKKYGDCKALCNYMYSLLKAAGIRSYYTLITAGENEEPADVDFVNDPFNHIVLCVPFKNDTTWLECTDMNRPFGKLGPFTENRNALLVTEEGGKLVNTPSSKMEDNVFDSDVSITIDPDGLAKAKMILRATGDYRNMCIAVSAQKVDEQKKFLINYLNLRQPDVFNLNYLSDKDGQKEMELDLTFESLSDMSTGNKYFLRPRIFDLWKSTFPITEKRRSDYFFSNPMIKKNTTSIIIPETFEVDALPADVLLNFSYGSYEARYSYDAAKHEVKNVSVFKLKQHVIPASKYNEMQKYMEDISRSMSKKLVLKKKV